MDQKGHMLAEIGFQLKNATSYSILKMEVTNVTEIAVPVHGGKPKLVMEFSPRQFLRRTRHISKRSDGRYDVIIVGNLNSVVILLLPKKWHA